MTALAAENITVHNNNDVLAKSLKPCLVVKKVALRF